MPFEDLTGIKRTIFRWLFLGLLIVMSVNMYFHIQSISDRRAMKTAQLERTEYDDAVTDARSRVAVNIINAVSVGRAFTQEEKEQIKSLWKAAKFDRIQKEFIEPTEKEK